VNNPAKILVVDDEDAGRFVKTQTLRRAGFHVLEAATGSDALALAASERPDLVVLDVNLPDISGLEVARRLRVAESAPPVPQILQISNTAVTAADRVRGLEHGADVYLTEPVESGVLVATVNALLRVRQAETALAAALDGERKARQIAEHASRLKDEFIATLSHELRTPLNALMGWIWQLRHTSLTEEARQRALDSLERNARMQAQLINDLLDVSRASKGKLQLEMRLVNLQDVVTDALEFVREAVERQQLQLEHRLTPVWVAGDLARLQQIVTNLVTNAVQFTPRNGRISVTLAEDGNDAVLSVQDTGAGIEAAFLPHVFDQFRQGEGGLSRKHGGLGLGLSVVKQLIELHDGSVSVTSPGPAHGTTFTVRLPRESTRAHERPAGGRLLLQDISIRLMTSGGADAGVLRSVLESSGARVADDHTPPANGGGTPAPETDLTIVDTGSGPLTLECPATDNLTQPIARTASPSHIVRTVARTMVTGRTP
jgi:signal transduction histidine kinase